MERKEIVETALGDLIVALTEETTPFVRDEKETYNVVAFMLMQLLYNEGAASRTRQYWQ